MFPFRVVAFSIDDGRGWRMLGSHTHELTARAHARSDACHYQCVAVVLVRNAAHNPHLELIHANTLNPYGLLTLPEFVAAVTGKESP